MLDLIPLPSSTAAAGSGGDLPDFVREAIADSVSPNTKANYASQLRKFSAWCQKSGRTPLPASPETVAAYLGALHAAGASPSTLTVARAAIKAAHAAADAPDPTTAAQVRKAAAGFARQSARAGRVERKAREFTLSDLSATLSAIPADDLLGVRDRALLAFGWWSSMRRAEIAAVRVEHLTSNPDGSITVLIPISKGDKAAAGQYVQIIPTGGAQCPVRLLSAWLNESGLKSGYLWSPFDMRAHAWRFGRAIDGKDFARILRRRAVAAGIEASRVSGHSTRRGWINAALRAGASALQIREQTRHKSDNTLQRYVVETGAQARKASGLILAAAAAVDSPSRP